ncbi:MAG TPA: glycosyltransferase family 9 protein [Pseudobdellovibrionaceae bacterium]|nr:glycosyltransferase family 9 protein [Pseudobdellovibrionaceae bacterium]
MNSNVSAQVFVQTAFLGDLVLSVPTLVHIKKLWPHEKLILVARRGVGSFLKDLKIIDELIEIEKGNSESYQKAQLELTRYEILRLFSPHESLRTTFFVSQIRSPSKISYKNFWSYFFYNYRVSKNLKLPEALRQLSLLGSFDLELQHRIEETQTVDYTAKNSKGLLPAPPPWGVSFFRDQVLSLNLKIPDFQLPKPFICLFPGSTWATKKWTEEGFTQLAQGLVKRSINVVLMGSSEERSLCERIQKQVPGVVNLAGKTSILETLSLMVSSKMVVGNDSASAHLASLVQTPTLTFFGPTVLSQGFRPWGERATIIENDNLECRPCGKHGPQRCPLGTHECMKSLSVEQALAVINSQNGLTIS